MGKVEKAVREFFTGRMSEVRILEIEHDVYEDGRVAMRVTFLFPSWDEMKSVILGETKE